MPKMRRLRYWVALKCTPELIAYAKPTAAIFAHSCRLLLIQECRYIDPETDNVLLRIAGKNA